MHDIYLENVVQEKYPVVILQQKLSWKFCVSNVLTKNVVTSSNYQPDASFSKILRQRCKTDILLTLSAWNILHNICVYTKFNSNCCK